MDQEIMALCRAMGATECQEELLLVLIGVVREQLAERLKEGVAVEDCGPAFPLAAAMMAMDRASGMTGGGGIASFTAGDLTVKREGGKPLSAQAEGLLAPWLRDAGGFAFQGVDG